MGNQSEILQSNIQSICIIGTGFRGLGVLERIFAYSKQNKSSKSFRVHLIEPSSEGPEQYDIHQPDYLLLNIVCGQVSIFPDTLSVPDCPPTEGQNLYEWVRDRGLLIDEDGFTVGNKGRPIEADDFLPRRLLGEYLLWFRELIKKQAELFIDIVEHKAIATDLVSDKNRFILELNNGSTIDTDYIFITVGQLPQSVVSHFENESVKYIARPYPLPKQLKSVKSGEVIAINGLGLTAFDAILTLTIGRGGKIETHYGIDEYIPSGKEPNIIAFSRSGLPYRSRPAIGAPLKYDPIVFNRSNIDALRTSRGIKLDYDRDILPLLFTEMNVAFHRAKYGRDFGWDKTENLLDDLRNSFAEGDLEIVLSELYNTDSILFNPKITYLESLIEPKDKDSIALFNSLAFASWFRKWLEDDLEESRLGTNLSPLKAALEACREFRDIIRYAVEFGSLTNDSSDRFFSFHSETLNRIGVGPQKEHTAIILALMKAGILNVSLGPNPKVSWDNTINQWKLSSTLLQEQHDIFADWLYRGSSSHIQNINDDTSIVGAMARKGFLRRLRPDSSVIHAVDINRCLNPISNTGIANKKIWIMGLLCEGATFYNGYVTSPRKFVRSQHDADIAVAQIFSQITESINC